MKKRMISTMLTAAMAVTLVLGVSTLAGAEEAYDPASAGDVAVGFSWWGNQVRDEVTKAALDHFTELYPNVTFNLNAQTWNDYWAQMTSFSSSDTLPDLMQQD